MSLFDESKFPPQKGSVTYGLSVHPAILGFVCFCVGIIVGLFI